MVVVRPEAKSARVEVLVEPGESAAAVEPSLDVILAELAGAMDHVREVLANSAMMLRHLDHGGSLSFAILQLEEQAAAVRKHLSRDRS